MKKGSCQECNDSGWIIAEEDGVETVRRCRCFQTKRKKQLLASARIPFRYRHCTFDIFETAPKGKTPPELQGTNQVNLSMAKDLAEDFVRKYPIIKKEGLFFPSQSKSSS
ncbi:MAG: hypothetical protein ACMUIM_12555 [bacterium]